MDRIDQLIAMVSDLQSTVNAQRREIHELKDTVRRQGEDTKEELASLMDEVQFLRRWKVKAPHGGEDILEEFEAAIATLQTSDDAFGCYARVEGTRVGPYFDYNIFKPYWKDLAQAMETSAHLRQIKDSSSLFLNKLSIGNEPARLIGDAFKTSNLRALYLTDVDCTNVFCADMLSSPVLETFHINQQHVNKRNILAREQDVELLKGVIEDHPSLNTLELKCCGPPKPSPSLIPIILASSHLLRRIDIHDCNLATFGSASIADFIASNPGLQGMFLQDNHLDDSDAGLIGAALMTNCNLTRLSLAGNKITEHGRQGLLSAMFCVGNLNSISDCNHTCDVGLGQKDDQGGPYYTSRHRFVPPCDLPRINCYERAKQLKMLAIISAPWEKTVNTSLLRDMPSQLLPDVLGLVQTYPIDELALNIMTELVPDPDVPPNYPPDPVTSPYGQQDPWESETDDEYPAEPTAEERNSVQQLKCLAITFDIMRKWGARGYIADRPERSHQLGLQLTPPRTSDAAFEVRGRQRRRRERRLTPLQRTTDRGWTKPPGTPAGNVTRYAALGSLD
ncbi:hypothetical protein THAOC_15466 [Thalassiosira oceanica]|uniref:RNI-like protein n=1 Tax=Thalassiosira oceanica TaxID=159749 RepID=K0SFR5_THAOC|nr:hypothetical protein THAOC_15466 [Thalassiosira oceanica]|eukprot:EJK63854.1 hypothetical protein THAOC_15466 [Thalassiosira oceanica]